MRIDLWLVTADTDGGISCEIYRTIDQAVREAINWISQNYNEAELCHRRAEEFKIALEEEFKCNDEQWTEEQWIVYWNRFWSWAINGDYEEELENFIGIVDIDTYNIEREEITFFQSDIKIYGI